jgi:CRP-like cAMP-binding protein
LRDSLEPAALNLRAVLVSPGEPMTEVYFPEAGLGSIIARTGGDRALEVGLYGWDGMSGAALLLGVDRTPHEHVVQVEGSAHRIAAADLLQAVGESATLQALLLKYVQVFTVQTAYTALSNGGFDVEARLARWLLMCDDRTDDGVHLTHDFLGIMLGVRRASVTVALQALVAAGLVEASRGHVNVLDRPRLEAAAGDSYGVPESEYTRLIGPFR